MAKHPDVIEQRIEVLHLALYLSRNVECNVHCRMESCVVADSDRRVIVKILKLNISPE